MRSHVELEWKLDKCIDLASCSTRMLEALQVVRKAVKRVSERRSGTDNAEESIVP